MGLPRLPDLREISARLSAIFPDGTPKRLWVTRELAAKVVFTMLYVGAVEGNDRWLGPKNVYRMGAKQASRITDEEREKFVSAANKPGFVPSYKSWYADNSRESIRDETLRYGLVELGAVIVRSGIPTTSGKGRYALGTDFARLFNPELTGDALAREIASWQSKHLSAEARARLKIVRSGRTAARGSIAIELPGGESRKMSAGVSSIITKHVIEVFAPQFLVDPAVIWISESGNKIVQRDDTLAREIGLNIRPELVLPDIILADASYPLLLIFVEVVATDGPVDESRKNTLIELAKETRISTDQLIFVTAYLDRNGTAFKTTVPRLAWGSFAWFASEPSHLIALDGIHAGPIGKIRDFLKTKN
jgi:hypothetical protein